MAPPSAKCLLIGSTEAYSGKSGTILGLAQQLQSQGFKVAYAKPLGTCVPGQESTLVDQDVQFLGEILGLSPEQIGLPLVYLHPEAIAKRLEGLDTQDYSQMLSTYAQLSADWLLLEGAGYTGEGSLFGLSLTQMANLLDAAVLLVIRYNSVLLVDSILETQRALGNRLLGVVINDIPPEHLPQVKEAIKPYLERQKIAVFGLIPRSSLLRSVSVREITQQLKAEVLCRSDRLDLMVESLTIGAMNVNAALEYFRKGQNMAVVTGGDRTDLQMAALETSTNCLILTGHIAPDPLILSRAEDLEIPILAVNLDTLSTVEIVDQAFGKVRLQEKIKVECLAAMMREHFALDKLLTALS